MMTTPDVGGIVDQIVTKTTAIMTAFWASGTVLGCKVKIS
jgi:hypothetical protein